VDFSAFWPDPSDPLNPQANDTKPIEGLENMLKVEVAAGDKNKTFDFEPAFMNPGHYEAPFFPTVETTYNYTLFGEINGTDFRATWTCSPAGGEGTEVYSRNLSKCYKKINDGKFWMSTAALKCRIS
jgi:hypothetical protein